MARMSPPIQGTIVGLPGTVAGGFGSFRPESPLYNSGGLVPFCCPYDYPCISLQTTDAGTRVVRGRHRLDPPTNVAIPTSLSIVVTGQNAKL